MSEIRYDLINDEYTIIAPERLRRPDSFYSNSEVENIDTNSCPFCVGNESMTKKEIFSLKDSSGNWLTRVVPNLYKAVQIEVEWINEDLGAFERWAGFGAHEVVIDTPRHLLRMDEWRLDEYINWLITLKARLCDLKNDLRLVYFAIFKNQGREAGATQTHPHSQIIALPIVPKSIRYQMLHAHRYYKEYGISIFQKVISQELSIQERIVSQSDSFIAISPFASSFPFEVMFISKNSRFVSLCDLGRDDIEELSTLMQETIKALYRELGVFDFNILINTPPMQRNYATEDYFEDIPLFWRFAITITPRLYRLGGFELSSRMKINPISPERVARVLKK